LGLGSFKEAAGDSYLIRSAVYGSYYVIKLLSSILINFTYGTENGFLIWLIYYWGYTA